MLLLVVGLVGFLLGSLFVRGPVTPEPSKTEPPAGFQEIDVRFKSFDGLTLAGTLTLPAASEVKKPPVMLMIAGSGPVDRDENGPGLKSEIFKQIAHRLAQQGIASLRYDKRGIGYSEGDLRKACMRDLVEDARAALKFLRGRSEIDTDLIYVLGHSEGGVLGAIVAAEEPVAGLISIAANARPLDEVILWQLEGFLRAQGLPEEEIQRELEKQRKFNEWVKQSEGEWDDYTFEEVQEAIPGLTREEWQNAQGVALCWLREHFLHDPLETMRQIGVPVLILQGDKDVQVPPEDAKALAQALKDAGNKNVEVHVFDDLNHMLRRHPEDPYSGDLHLNEPVDERVSTAVANWVPKQRLVGKALAFVQLLVEGKFNEAYERFDAAMRRAMPPEKLQDAWEQITTQAGEFIRVVSTRFAREMGFRVVYVTCKFAYTPLNVKVVFDREEKVTGLWFLPVK